MSGLGPNEIEERRVIRLLAETAEDVAPLPEDDVDALLRAATLRSAVPTRPRRSLARQLHYLAAAGAAAAVVAGSSVLTASQPQPASTGGAGGQAALAQFPEGSALGLLLSSRGSDARS